MSYSRSVLLAGSMLLEIADDEAAWDLWLSAVATAQRSIDADDEQFTRWATELGDGEPDEGRG